MGIETIKSPYASLGRRFVALMLDSLILFIPCGIASHTIPVIGGLVIFFFYAPVLESSEVRATIGKYLMGIQVNGLHGEQITFRAALIRNFIKFFSSALLFIGYLFALFTEKRQTLHDLLADTLVENGKSDRSIGNAWLVKMKQIFGSQS